jgi:hypothetical protein
MTALPAPLPLLAPAPLAKRLFTLPNILTALFLLVCGLFTFHHPLWRDEAQAFLIGRDSHSLGQLLYNLRYEGHPPLWHFLIFLLTRVTLRPEAMQAMHLLMAAGSVYLVARFSPFPWPLKILFPFGYFPLFEYGIISRNYQLLLLLTLALCALWQHRRFSFLWTGILLGLLCLTHVFGDILAAGLGTMFLADALLTPEGRAAIRQHPYRLLLGLLFALAAAGASVKLLIPPPDSGYKPAWHLQWQAANVQRVLSDFWTAYVPLPQHTENFWDTNILADPVEQVRWGVTLAVAALLGMIYSWRAMLVFITITLGSLAFFYIKLTSGATRHHGVLFITLLASFWIAWVIRKPRPPSPNRFSRWSKITLRLIPRVALFALLAVHVYAAAVALYYCAKYPFTPGKQAAAVIRNALRPGDILVSGNQIITTSVAAYLPHQIFYFPVGDRWGTFTWWDQTPWMDAPVDQAMQFIGQQNHPVIFIRCWDPGPVPGGKLLGQFDSGIEENEMYSIYRIEPKQIPRQ